MVQVGQNRFHPTMALGLDQQSQLGEHAAYVALHRADVEHEVVGDRRVVVALRHETEHLAFPVGKLIERIVAALALEQSRHHLRVDRGIARRDPPHRGHELLDIGDAVLQQVANRFGASLDQLERVSGLDVLGEHDHRHLGVAFPERDGGLEALGCMARWHANIDDHQVGFRLADHLGQIQSVAAFGHHLDARVGKEPGAPFEPETWTEVRYKGGNEPGVLALAWWLERSDGRQFVMATGISNPEAPVDESAALPVAINAIALLADE